MAETEAQPRTGLEIRPAHFPGRPPIDTYGNGGFRFADMSHQGSILCLPSGVYGWEGSQLVDLTKSKLKRLLSEEGVEVVLFGTGVDLAPLNKSLRDALAKKGMRADPMSTGAAARTYNVLLAEGRPVAAVLLAVD